jgi:Carboxypeptidase regulatory-like domain
MRRSESLNHAFLGRHRARSIPVISELSGKGIRPLLLLVILLLAVSASVFQAAGQTTNAAITGEVKDPSGAAIAGSTVTAVNTQTGIERSATTDEAGLYTMVNVPPGVYNVRAEGKGFATVVRQKQEFLLGTTVTLDFTLPVAEVNQTVEVSAQNPLQIETTQSTVSRILEPKELDSLPVLNRQFAALATMTPGVQSTGVNQASTSSVTSATVSIGNSPTYSTSYVVDGVTNETGNQGGPYVQLSQDWVQEFSVLALQFPAEYGDAAGGVVNVITRSGTNSIHGRVYDFYQNAALNSNPEFYKGTSKAPFNSDRVGGMVGGPIIKDKLFYFGGFEYFHNVNTFTLGSTGATGTFASTAQPVGTPQADLVPWLIYGQATSGPSTVDSRLAMLKIDYVPNSQNSFSFRSNLDYEYSNNGVSGATTLGSATGSFAPAYADTISWTRTFSANTINELRFGYLSIATRRINNYVNAKGPYAGITLNSDPYNYVTTASLGGQTTLGNPIGNWATVAYNGVSTGGSALVGVTAGDAAGVLSDTFTHIKSNHQIKVGFSVRRLMSWGTNDHNNSDGNYRFGATPGPFNPTAAASINGNTSGGAPVLNLLTQPVVAGNFTTASKLAPTSYSVSFACCPPPAFEDFYFPAYQFGVFLQDSWQKSSNLSLNLGIRYDFNNSNSSLGEAPFPAVKAADPGSMGFIRSGFHKINNDPLDISPRFGFAWTPFHGGNITLIRGGLGIFYDQVNNANDPIYEGNNTVDTGGGFSFAPNVATNNPYCSGNNTCATQIPVVDELAVADVLASALANYTLPVFPTSTSPCVATNSCTVTVGSNTYTIPGLTIPYTPQGGLVDIQQNYKTPGTMQATIGVEHEFTPSFNASADFVYHRDFNGIVSVNTNAALAGTGASQTFTSVNPAYTSIKTFESIATGVAKDLQVQAHYRDNRGDIAALAYQFGYSNDDSVSNFLVSSVNATTTNPFNLNYDYGPSTNDARHMLTASGSVNMYWGIYLSPIVSVTSALPYTATSTLQAPGSADAPPGCLAYFAKCYPVVNGVTYSRNSLRGDPFFSLSARISKTFKLGESRSIMVLIEGFNLTNKHNLGTNFFTNVDASNFGTPNGTSLPLRQFQVGGRFDF